MKFWKAKKVVSRAPVWTIIDSEIDDIAKRSSVELESATSSELSSASYARMILSLSDVDYENDPTAGETDGSRR